MYFKDYSGFTSSADVPPQSPIYSGLSLWHAFPSSTSTHTPVSPDVQINVMSLLGVELENANAPRAIADITVSVKILFFMIIKN